MLKEIRIHGRGGQGSVTAAELLAHAAFIEGKWVQAFPYFGAERRGAPVKAFTRISDESILVHSQVYNPDYVIVLDPAIYKTVDVTEGLKKDGIIILNTTKNPAETGIKNYKVATVDATGIALELNLLVAGSPVVNTSIIGAFAKATEEIKLENVVKAIKETWSGAAGEKNARAAELAYDRLIKGW
ncbi:MAG: pyruvate ferredoxin oxidoreductase subunit gamma [Candidatus Bathyarchaeota archaeon]|nr:pyruvate ferredoxin oxidoreductase subunit gamma [Candidatus Bathyarchaeota archaeon A05DMB-5]MDH7557265.1 pyruvate ferredoxin oxidoreductase subunit gamma [Candidatus Bathyarchaeota archaeon]